MRLAHNGLAALLTLSLVACGGSSTGSTTPPPPEAAPAALPLAQLVDPSAMGIFRLDISGLSQSPHYQTMMDILSLAIEIYDPTAAGLIQILMNTQELVMFITRDEGGEVIPVMLLRGNYTPGDAQRMFPADLEVREETEHGIRLFRLQDGLAAAVGNHTLILGRRRGAEAAVQRQLDPGTGHYPNEGAFGTLVTELGIETSHFGYAVSFDDDIRHEIASELDIPRAVLDAFTGMGLQATVTTGVEVRGTFMSDSSIQAAALLLLANQIIARLRTDDDMQGLGFEGVLGAIRLRRDGGNLLLTLSMSNEQVRASAAQMQEGLRREDSRGTPSSAP